MFDNYLVDCIINELSNSNSIYYETFKLCYIGFRPTNTLKMHEKFAGENSYPFKYDHLYKIGSQMMLPFFKMFYSKVSLPKE
jgi:cytosolic carboxypeptidase protein 2/3